MSDVEVVKANAGHAPAIARIHSSALAGGFLSSLGLSFLADVYYPAVLHSDLAMTFVAVEAGHSVVGFLTVAPDSPSFVRDVRRGRLGRMAVAALRVAVRRPSHLLESLAVCRQTFSRGRDPVPAEIIYVAVASSHRRRGIADRLIAAAAEYLAGLGISEWRTKTLASNEHVIALYERMGWRIRSRFSLIGRDYVTLVGPVLQSGGRRQ